MCGNRVGAGSAVHDFYRSEIEIRQRSLNAAALCVAIAIRKEVVAIRIGGSVQSPSRHSYVPFDHVQGNRTIALGVSASAGGAFLLLGSVEHLHDDDHGNHADRQSDHDFDQAEAFAIGIHCRFLVLSVDLRDDSEVARDGFIRHLPSDRYCHLAASHFNGAFPVG